MSLPLDRTRPDPVVATLTGELDAGEPRLDDTLDELIAAGHRRIVVDLLNVTFIDSSVVRALVTAYRRCVAADGWVRIVYHQHLIGRVIEICGLAEAFPQYSTVDAALRGAPTGSHQ